MINIKTNILIHKIAIYLFLFIQFFFFTGCNSYISSNKLSKNIIVLSSKKINMTAIRIDTEIIIIDTLYSPEIADRAKRIIEKKFPGSKITTVINTHAHFDHCYGNQVFKNAKIYAHFKAESWMKHYMEWSDNKKNINRNSKTKFVLTPADISIDKIKIINIKDIKIYLVPFGTGHSNSDIFIAIPELKILFVGDVFFKKGFPKFKTFRGNNLFPGNWDVAKSIRCLKTVLGLGKYKYVISGHENPIDPERIKMWFEYFRLLWKDIKNSVLKNLSRKEVIESAVSNSIYKPLFKKMNYSKFPLGHHRVFAEQFYISLKQLMR